MGRITIMMLSMKYDHDQDFDFDHDICIFWKYIEHYIEPAYNQNQTQSKSQKNLKQKDKHQVGRIRTLAYLLH